ncbi:MAG: VCBS repeat-containing protein, partial [Planctomycetales bacterium]|nr:VCBS repeat-containing protein [Planctomycetales bacterium]
DEDILATNPIALYENVDGNGTFALRQTIHEERVAAIAFADVDLDKDIDIVSMSSPWGFNRSTPITWHENVNDIFEARHPVDAHSINAPGSVLAVDLDGDGDSDVLAPLKWRTIGWYENLDGKGTFGSAKVIAQSEFESIFDFAGISVQAGDVDGDGDIDVLAHVSEQDSIVWYENIDGTGSFADARVLFVPPRINDDPFGFEVADLDGDSALDLLIFDSMEIAWYKNEDGRGTYRAVQTIYDHADDPYVGMSVVVDFDGDGDVDLLKRSRCSMEFIENNGTGNFLDPIVLLDDLCRRLEVFRYYDYFFTVSDVDLDGDLDFVWPDEVGFFWRENRSDNIHEFTAPEVLVTTQFYRSRPCAFVDLDGDDDLDIVATVHDGNYQIAWYERRLLGDVNDDGIFNSTDLVLVFQAGEYEDQIVANSTFDDGDWNGDGEFDSADLVRVFQAGTYDAAAISTSDVAGAIDQLLANDDLLKPRFGIRDRIAASPRLSEYD